jgi:hypothetical protein
MVGRLLADRQESNEDGAVIGAESLILVAGKSKKIFFSGI